MPFRRLARPLAGMLFLTLPLAALPLAALPLAAQADQAHRGVAGRSAKPVLYQEGKASYYGRRHHGRKTASGERFDRNKLTAASPNLPLGSKVTVTNKETGKSVRVTVTDRMRARRGRIIDLSERAARQIGVAQDGTAPVRVEIVR